MLKRVGLLGAVVMLAAALSAVPASGSTSDPLRAAQWGLDRIQAEQAWRTSTGTGALVAVVDTGVDLGHPDLAANLAGDGADFVAPDGTCKNVGKGKNKTRECVQDHAQDENGHGTHVAGIISAVTNNGTGVASVAPDAQLLPVRVLDADGGGTTEQIAAGIRYAADQGADVINLSLGFLSGVGEVVKVIGDLDPVYEAVDHAYAEGAVVVFAAGNDGVPLCAEPAAHPKVICVGATDPNDVKSWYSNTDATSTKYFVAAPGGAGSIYCRDDVLSTYLRGAEVYCADDGYEALAGTSMAAPHVSGVAALLAAQGLSNQAIMECIIATADDLGVPGRDSIYGYGRVNAASAVTGC